jgi:predicted nucleic acid-binding protein
VIIVDTNIASVLMAGVRHTDDEVVDQWLNDCADERICVTVVTRAEIGAGIAVLPDGRRKESLVRAAGEFFESMADHTLPFNSSAADAYGQIIAERQRQGRPVTVLDAQIAAIARCAHAKVATRNDKDFQGLGLTVINPYRSATWGR